MEVKSRLSSVAGLHRVPEIWIFVAAAAVRLLILSRFAASPYFLPASDDMKFYADWAIRIGDGNWTDGTAFYGLPGYAFCLAGIFCLFGFCPFVVGLLQGLLEAVTTVLIFKIAKHSFSFSQIGKKHPDCKVDAVCIGVLAALAWIFFLPAQTFSTILMPNAWLLVAFWGCVWWLSRSLATPPPWTWLGFGIGIGLVAMMIATVLFVLPLFLFWIMQRVECCAASRGRYVESVLAAILLLLGTFIGMSPAWLHNCQIAKDPVPALCAQRAKLLHGKQSRCYRLSKNSGWSECRSRRFAARFNHLGGESCGPHSEAIGRFEVLGSKGQCVDLRESSCLALSNRPQTTKLLEFVSIRRSESNPTAS